MEDGMFIELEYVGKVRETGEIFDLTDEKLAKEKKIFSPQVKYGPITIILGNHQVLAGLEKRIKELKAGEKKVIVLEPKDAFGERSAELIKTIALSEFIRHNVQPQAGQYLRLSNGVEGRVLSVSGGRVRVDFNHPLSGKSLEYDIKVNRIVGESDEQISAILAYYSKAGAKSVHIDKEKGIASIELGNDAALPPEAKKRISGDITKFVKGVKEVKFIENFAAKA